MRTFRVHRFAQNIPLDRPDTRPKSVVPLNFECMKKETDEPRVQKTTATMPPRMKSIFLLAALGFTSASGEGELRLCVRRVPCSVHGWLEDA